MSRSLSLVAAALVLGAAPGLASGRTHLESAGRPTTVVIRVPTGDLDLTREAGADALLRRLAMAAYRACGGSPTAGSAQYAEAARAFRTCITDAQERAVAQVDAPMVQKRYAARRGHAPFQLARKGR